MIFLFDKNPPPTEKKLFIVLQNDDTRNKLWTRSNQYKNILSKILLIHFKDLYVYIYNFLMLSYPVISNRMMYSVLMYCLHRQYYVSSLFIIDQCLANQSSRVMLIVKDKEIFVENSLYLFVSSGECEEITEKQGLPLRRNKKKKSQI
ncbi:hypothetical protein KUTeg_010248 [Tegillarca granosa]|uniref:Uncharacterized protein n=1 Tax=Tegillarca granosa TaxID=220873 RepID=A0ABQ9F663_TEGGR|nr:hypothetical protein KUTeg_010248 [Tegillarca granosa]